MDIPSLKNKIDSGSAPIYECIISSIRELIISGELKAGERLPTDRTLAAELSVNHITVAKALNELRRMGLLSRRRAIGTFVNSLPETVTETAKMKKIAVVFDSADEHTFHAGFFLALYKALEKSGMSMQFFSAGNSPEKQFNQIKNIICDANINGCIVWSILSNEAVKKLLSCKPSNFPLIFLDKHYNGLSHDSVTFNNRKYAKKLGQILVGEAVSHIYWLKHKHPDFSSIKDRFTGLCEGAKNLRVNTVDDYDELPPFTDSDTKYALVLPSLEENVKLEKFLKKRCTDHLILSYFEVDHQFDPDCRSIICRFKSEDMAKKAVEVLSARFNGEDAANLTDYADGKILSIDTF